MSSNGQPKVEISYIGCTQIEKETKNIWGSKKKNYLQQFSIKLKLLSTIDKDVCDITQSELKSLTEEESKLIIPQVQKVITFFKTCLYENKNFTVDINISKASEELYNKYRDTIANKDKTVEGFIRNAPHQILLQGITIKLRANIKDINLDNLYKIESRLDEKLKQAEAIENKKEQSEIEPTHQETEQNKQVVPVGGSFGYNVTNSGKLTRAPIVVEAMRNNFHWFRSFFWLPNVLNTVQFFLRQPLELSMKKKPKAIQGPEEVKQDEVTQDEVTQNDEVDVRKIDKVITSAPNVGQTTSYTDYFKANRKKSKVKIEQTQEQLEEKRLTIKEEKQLTIKQAQNDARVALLNNAEGKKLDEIFIEIISEYKNQDSETFRNIFNSVFNVVYFQDKQLHEVLEPDEKLETLKTLEIPQPTSTSHLGKEYLQRQVYRKKKQLLELVTGIYQQQPSAQPENSTHKSTNPSPSNIEKNQTPHPLPKKKAKTQFINIRLKLSLETVFSSKETYFCLIVIGAFIFTLCLWHLPLGKVSILQGLVPEKKRENIGLILNIGLPILVVLCVLNLAHFLYSEYNGFSVESVKRMNANKSLPGT